MADLNIKALLEILIKGGNLPAEVTDELKKLRQEADNVEPSLKKTKSGLDDLGSVGENALRRITAALAAFASVDFLKSAVVDAAKMERQFSALADLLDHLGQGGGQGIGRIRQELEGIAARGGPLVSETLPAYAKFVGILGDTDAALAATQMAANLSETGFRDMGTSVGDLVGVLQGRAKMAANELGLSFFKLNGEKKTSVELAEEVIDRYSKESERFRDTENDISRLSAAWEELKIRTGGALGDAAGIAADFVLKLIDGVRDAKVVLTGFYDVASSVAQAIGSQFVHALDLKRMVVDPKGYFDALRADAMDMTIEIGRTWETANIRMDNIAKSRAQDQIDREKDMTAAIGKFKEQARLASIKADELEAYTKAKEAADAEVKLAQVRLQATKEGSDERLAAELDLLEKQRAAAIVEAKHTGESVQAVNAAFDAEREQKVADNAAKEAAIRIDARIRATDAEIEASKQADDKVYALRLQRLDLQAQKEMLLFKGSTEARQAIEQTYLLMRLALAAKASDEEQKTRASLNDALRSADSAQLTAQADLEAAQARTKAQQDQAEADRKAAERATELADLEVWYKRQRDLYIGNLQALALIDQIYGIRKKTVTIQGNADQAAQDKKLADSKLTLQKQIATQSVALARAAFGDNKAIAAAQIVVDTSLAVMEIWKAYGGLALTGITEALIALVVATGAAQLANLNRATPGGAGFDDPVHDRIAYIGGRRWAEDQVRNVTQGLQAGFEESASSYRVPALAGAMGGGAVGGGGDTHLNFTFTKPVIGSERRVAQELYRIVLQGQRADRGRGSW